MTHHGFLVRGKEISVTVFAQEAHNVLKMVPANVNVTGNLTKVTKQNGMMMMHTVQQRSCRAILDTVRTQMIQMQIHVTRHHVDTIIVHQPQKIASHVRRVLHPMEPQQRMRLLQNQPVTSSVAMMAPYFVTAPGALPCPDLETFHGLETSHKKIPPRAGIFIKTILLNQWRLICGAFVRPPVVPKPNQPGQFSNQSHADGRYRCECVDNRAQPRRL